MLIIHASFMGRHVIFCRLLSQIPKIKMNENVENKTHRDTIRNGWTTFIFFRHSCRRTRKLSCTCRTISRGDWRGVSKLFTSDPEFYAFTLRISKQQR